MTWICNTHGLHCLVRLPFSHHAQLKTIVSVEGRGKPCRFETHRETVGLKTRETTVLAARGTCFDGNLITCLVGSQRNCSMLAIMLASRETFVILDWNIWLVSWYSQLFMMVVVWEVPPLFTKIIQYMHIYIIYIYTAYICTYTESLSGPSETKYCTMGLLLGSAPPFLYIPPPRPHTRLHVVPIQWAYSQT